MPRSGAEYAYFMDSFGPLHKFWGNLPAFTASWVYVVVLRPAEVAVIILTFAEYVCQPILDGLNLCPDHQYLAEHAKKLTALVALGILLLHLFLFISLHFVISGIMTYINVSSVKLYVKIQNIFGSFKVIACLIVIFGGIYQICSGDTQNLEKGFEGTSFAAKDIALAFYSGLWAYDGW